MGGDEGGNEESNKREDNSERIGLGEKSWESKLLRGLNSSEGEGEREWEGEGEGEVDNREGIAN